jgi:SAM-dependent methyltransferase
MHGLRAIDAGRSIDWSKTSADYLHHRPGPPPRFYDTLAAWGVGLPGQRVLDLGTGTGLLARRFAAQGARVAGTDIAAGQIEAARAAASDDGVEIDFRVAPAETLPFAEASFDAVTAMQCWLYFDPEAASREVKRVLAPGGVLVTAHFSWLPRRDAIARASEALVLEHNPDWGGADWPGEIPAVPQWSKGRFDVTGMFWFDAPIAFTRESWRGRIRACRGIGATLDADAVARFDAAHAELLGRIAPEEFTVLHRIDAHRFVPIR